MRRIVRLASLGVVACLGAIQAAIAAPIYRVRELFPLPGHARPRVSRFFLSALANIAVAGFLAQLAMAANGAELFVSSRGQVSGVKRYDVATGAFLGDFVTPGSGGLGGLWLGLGFGPDGNLYVANGGPGNNVLRYSGVSGAFLGEFAAVPGPFPPPLIGLGFGPDANLYVTTNSPGAPTFEVVRFDSNTGAFMDIFTSGTGGGTFPFNTMRSPFGFTWGPDGNLYVASPISQIRRYDGTTGVFIDVFAPVGPCPPQVGFCVGTPTDVTFGPDGNLYVSTFSGVQRFDGLTGAFIDVFAAEGHFGVRFGPDGNLYVGDGPNGVLRYNGATGAFIDVFASGGGLSATFLTFRAVPEPSPLWLLSAAFVGLVAAFRLKGATTRSTL